MGNKWPRISKVIISLVPAFLILLGVIPVLAGWEAYHIDKVRFGTWMVIGGALLFLFEIVIIYYTK